MTKDNTNGSGPAETPHARSPRILEALGYLNQCRQHSRSFAILTGESPRDVEFTLRHFSRELSPATRVARILAPTDSSHAFLEAILAQLGFEPFESTADDLQRLLNVVLRQSAAQHAQMIILIEHAQDFGPRVFETIRELARNSRDISPPPLIVMIGHAGLNRVLDSPGMASVAQQTRLRFNFDTPSGGLATSPDLEAPAPQAVNGPTLTLSIGDEDIREIAVDRDRMLIGRSQHCDICIASRYVSRQHALLLRNPDGDWLIDLKSTNGTSVNSKLVGQHRLDDGDIVAIGNHRLRYANPAGRPDIAAAKPHRDQLSETMVMRSLQALRAVPDDTSEQSGNSSTAA